MCTYVSDYYNVIWTVKPHCFYRGIDCAVARSSCVAVVAVLVFGTQHPLHPEISIRNFFFNVDAKMTAIFKMAADQNLIFRISTRF